MEASASEMVFSRDFFLSSAESSSLPQYSSLESSSSCSVFRVETISSIILITWSKPTFFPRRANSMNLSIAPPRGRRAFDRSSRARARSSSARTCTCMKLALAPGSVFLNSSRASSSLRILMVSASASSSACRTLERSSHSAVFVEQLFSSSARNFLSPARASEVSSRSFAICATETASSPASWIFSSICLVRAFTSWVFAAMSSS
mmetsp:Transcript_46429/g.120533  ORF Transcript_46429/g.120533 Transcript_46429/m.120533 type:complete len:206 (+) Transcript_46429:682-1299(+)